MEAAEDEEQKPNYLHIYPFRFVQPYPHVYRTFTKGRWIDKQLLATLVKEFKAYPPQYYEQAILTGKITVNQKIVECNYILKNGDMIMHTSIRTEPPVLDLPIEICSETEDFLIISKPPSIIVHTGGGHHYNTVESLLKYEKGYKNLHVLHRLDKLTSGLLIFAKSKENVMVFHDESERQIMKKMYFARVSGKVQWEEKTLEAYIECISHKDGVYKVIGEVKKIQKKIQQPILTKKGDDLEQLQSKNRSDQNIKKTEEKTQEVQKSSKRQEKLIEQQKKKKRKEKEMQNPETDIKDSKTIFKKIWYDEFTDSTLLECYPVTGRTHQIRVHLQYLGHPILNDIGYGGRFVGNGIIKYIEGKNSRVEEHVLGQPTKKLKHSEELSIEQWDYQTKPWEIMLHSYHYKFGGNSFTTKLPYWYEKESLQKWNNEQKSI